MADNILINTSLYRKDYNGILEKLSGCAENTLFTDFEYINNNILFSADEHLVTLNTLFFGTRKLIVRVKSIQNHQQGKKIIIPEKNVTSASSNIVDSKINENIFIIHGKNEAKWRELQSIIKDDFKLNPIVLMEQPNAGSPTIIEKFERYAPTCSYAFAIFTPDDQIEKEGVTYLQARPNVLFELGWFCAYLGRPKVCILLQKGTEIFSDFDGVLQKRFNKEVKELYKDIADELKHAEVI